MSLVEFKAGSALAENNLCGIFYLHFWSAALGNDGLVGFWIGREHRHIEVKRVRKKYPVISEVIGPRF